MWSTVDWTKARTTIGAIGDTINVYTKAGLVNALSTHDRSVLTKINLAAGDYIFNNEPLVLDSNVIIHGAGPSSR